jgi:uncharacterized membrane protein SpoIIM required for sporulation
VAEPPKVWLKSRPRGQGVLAALLAQLLEREWVKYVGVALIVELVVFVGALAYPVSNDEAYQSYQRGTALVQGDSQNPAPLFALSIFANNFRGALVFSIPVLGWISFSLSIFTTSRLVAGVEAYVGRPWYWGLAAGVTTPHFWMEFASYAAAVVQSFMLVLALFHKRPDRAELRRTALILAGVALTLAVAAVLEVVAIGWGVPGTLVGWGVFGGLAYLLYAVERKGRLLNSATQGAAQLHI